MKRILFGALAFILVLVPSYYIFNNSQKAKAAGTTYYVDQATGNDLDSGLTEDLAWATITKAANTLVAGDTVYIKNGTYREGVIFATSGTSGNPITFRNYSGHSPVMNGSLVAIGWSLHAGDVYKATWNNTSAGFWEDTDLLLTPNGAVPDAAGEWWLDDPNNTIYVWPSDSTHPDTHTYEASVTTIGDVLGNVVRIGNPDYLTFNGIKTIHANNDGINISGDSVGLVFANITVEDNASDGYSQHNTSSATMTNITANRNGKCNIVNVDSSYVDIDGLSMSQGDYGPTAAASVMFTNSASADIINANIDQGTYKNSHAFYSVSDGTINITDSTIIGGSSEGTIRTSESTTMNRVAIDSGSIGRTITVQSGTGDRAIIRNSVIKNIGSSDTVFTNDNSKIRIENSLVIGQSGGYAFWAWGANATVEVYNAIVANNVTRTFYRTSGTMTEDYNILWNSGGYTGGAVAGAHTISADPKFENYGAGNYHLLLTSPAIDSGISTYSSTTDRDVKQKYDHPDVANTGTGALTYYDRGPYEYILPPDPTFTSASHPSHVIWYANPSVNMALSSNGSSTTNYRYLVSTNAAPTQAEVLAGTFDADGTFAAAIPSDGDYYIHTLAVNLDNEPSTNYYSYLVKIDSHGPVINSFNLTEGQILSGTYTLFGNITDDYSGMDKVEFYIDNELKSTATSTPYQYDWDTTQYHSLHTVKIIAYDQAGNTTENTYNIQVVNQLPDTGSVLDRIIGGFKKPLNILLIGLALLIIAISSALFLKKYRR